VVQEFVDMKDLLRVLACGDAQKATLGNIKTYGEGVRTCEELSDSTGVDEKYNGT
jgi:hypothetical protein